MDELFIPRFGELSICDLRAWRRLREFTHTHGGLRIHKCTWRISCAHRLREILNSHVFMIVVDDDVCACVSVCIVTGCGCTWIHVCECGCVCVCV